MEKPFVKLFKTLDQKYVYDVNTNSILRINDNTYEKIARMQNSGTDLCEDKDIQVLLRRGYLKPNRKDTVIQHPATNMIECYLNGNIRQLILQVTQNCNLRCKYCVYSGSYVNRTHTLKRMSYDTAIKAIDFYHEHNFNREEAMVGFYGGEPLLELDLIKKIVEYAEQKFVGKKIKFNMTTNATLLNENVAEFLIGHDFNLTISLDGPEDVHNHSRVFADDKTGTFRCVIDNIEKILNKYPSYEKNLNINAVLDTQNDYKCSSDFFTYNFLKEALVTVTSLNENGNMNEIQYSDAFDINYRYELFKCMLKYVGRFGIENTSKITDNHFKSLRTELHERISVPYKRGKICHPSGPCIAGSTRLFVNTDGDFYPCERVNEKCDAYVIGNINIGFDINKIQKLLNIGQLIPNKCKNCWAIEYCNSCAAGIDDGDELSAEKKQSRCDEIKKGCELRFIEYCTLREWGCDFD